MTSITVANWALVFVTSVLCVATIVYAIISALAYKASKKQTEVVSKQVEALENQVTAQREQTGALDDAAINLKKLCDILTRIDQSLVAVSSGVSRP